MRRDRCLAIVIAILAVSDLDAQVALSQFAFPAPPPPPGVVFDEVRGEFVNFETQMTTPIVVTRGSQFVVVADEPDNRVLVFNASTLGLVREIPVGQGICAIAERPGTGSNEIWVTLRHQMATVVISTTTWRIIDLVRPPVPASGVGGREADSPGGVAFNANGTRAYVASTNTESLAVYNATTTPKTFIQNVALTAIHNTVPTAMNDPLCVVRAGGSICVASNMSGNQTMTSFEPASTLPDPKVLVKDISASATESLPDFDLMLVNPATLAITSVKTKIGSMAHGLAFHSGTNRILVSGYASRNAEFLGEGAFPDGKVAFNQLTIVDPAGAPAGPHTNIILEDLLPGSNPPVNIVMPTDITVDGTGRIFVAGHASSNIGVFSSAGAFLGVMTSQPGPRGLAFSGAQNRVYCLNRGANSVTYYNLAGGIPAGPAGSFALPDPTYDRVKAGRNLYNTPNSAKGTAFCGSCHPDVRKDGLGWDLSKYHDPGSGFSVSNPPQAWGDRKSVMVTQDLRALGEVPPYHWRGEQLDLDAFNDAFPNLLKGSKMSDPDFALLKEFLFSCVYPPNPFENMNRSYTATAVTGADAYQVDIADTLQLFGEQAVNGTCLDCHPFPTGSDCSITDPLILLPGSGANVKTTQMRGMWAKESPITNLMKAGAPVNHPSTGFGFQHDGLTDSAADFIDTFFAGMPRKDQIKVFMSEFDSGLAPATQWSEFINSTNASSNNVTFLVSQAIAFHCDVAVKGRMLVAGSFRDIGMFWDRMVGAFTADDVTAGGPFSLATLLAMSAAGQAEFLFLGVPVWSGERIGVDRDRDGLRDRDELLIGTLPANPDTDGDGFWDGEDSSPTGGVNTIPSSAPQVVSGSIRVVYVTTNSAKIIYETDRLSPTRVLWGEAGLVNASGDPFPLPTGLQNTTNLWKRRHTALIRLTKDGVAHNFSIVTQGQNNVTATTAQQATLPFLTDHHAANQRVKALVGLHSTGTTNYSVEVFIQDNAFQPVVLTNVIPRWTIFQNGVSTQQLASLQKTDSTGKTTFTLNLTPGSQVSGDKVIFDITMTFPFGATFFPSVISADRVFAWPENLASSVTMNF